MVQGSCKTYFNGRNPKFLNTPAGFLIGEHFVKSVQNDSYQVDYSHPLGKTILLVNHMWREQQYYAHVTMYQAQINPEKVNDNFKNFRNAFWPHLVKYEKKQEAIAKKKLLKETEKGLISFRPQIMDKKSIKRLNRDISEGGIEKFMPKPRERK